MSYLKNAIIGRRRKPSKIGGRGAPARSLRAPSGGPTFYNLPGPTGQKIIDMGFSLGKGVPDMKSFREFLTSLADAGFGLGVPFLAQGVGPYIYNFRSGGGSTGQRIIARVTDDLWEYTTSSNWKLGNPSTDWNLAVPYRMQDVTLWYKAQSKGQSFCDTSSMCRELVYHNELAMPWSYFATVQSGGTLRRRTRKGMINFLRDYSKYVRAQQSTGGIPFGDLDLKGTGLQQPQPTDGLNPLQRKMQRNTFKAMRRRR